MPTTEAFCGHAIRGKGGATKQSLTKAEIEAQGVVGLKGAEKKAWGRWVADVQSRGALAKVLKTGCFGGQSAAEKAVMLFINGKAGKGYTLKMNLGKPAVKWLLLAIKVAPHNAVVADMVRDLLGTQMFTGNLPVMEQWDPLYTGALEILEEIGNVALKPIFDQNNLGASMNDKVLQEHIIYHHLSPKDGGKPSQRLASPAFFDLLKDAYDYTDYTALPERKALVAFLLLCSLVSGEFSDAIDALRASLGNWCSAEVAGVKGFARCLVKLYADYYKLSSPRSQWVLDPLRCLLNGPNAVSMHAITAAISTHFGDGMLQCKNPFSLKEEKRADRNHLLLLHATIIFDAKKTIGALANGPTADRVFAAFKADTSHGLPTSQWNMLVDGGVAFLRSKMLTKVPAMVAAEIQFTMDAYMEGRTPMHWGYDIGRAGDASKLFANFNSGVIVMGEQGNSTTLYNACFSGHFAAVQHFLSASDSCIIDHVLTFTARGWLWRHALSLLPTPLQSVFVCISKNGLHQPLARLLPPRHAQMMQQRSATFHFCCSLCQ